MRKHGTMVHPEVHVLGRYSFVSFGTRIRQHGVAWLPVSYSVNIAHSRLVHTPRLSLLVQYVGVSSFTADKDGVADILISQRSL